MLTYPRILSLPICKVGITEVQLHHRVVAEIKCLQDPNSIPDTASFCYDSYYLNTMTYFIIILQMKRMRFGDTEAHTASKCWNWDLGPYLFNSQIYAFDPYFSHCDVNFIVFHC